MIVGKARSLPKREVLERYSAWLGSSLTHKHYSKPERPASGKRPSLFGPFVRYQAKLVLQR